MNLKLWRRGNKCDGMREPFELVDKGFEKAQLQGDGDWLSRSPAGGHCDRYRCGRRRQWGAPCRCVALLDPASDEHTLLESEPPQYVECCTELACRHFLRQRDFNIPVCEMLTDSLHHAAKAVLLLAVKASTARI